MRIQAAREEWKNVQPVRRGLLHLAVLDHTALPDRIFDTGVKQLSVLRRLSEAASSLAIPHRLLACQSVSKDLGHVHTPSMGFHCTDREARVLRFEH